MNRKKITIYIEKKEYLDFEFITSFVNSNLSFVPREINFQKRRSKKIFSSDDLESKFIEDDLWVSDSNTAFSFTIVDHGKTYCITNICLIDHNSNQLLIDHFVKKTVFLCAYEYDFNFVLFQGEESIDTLRSFGVDYNQYNLIPKYDFPYLKVDISKNPGRLTWDENICIDIGVTWKMWFSMNVRKLFKGKPMEFFPNSYLNNLIENDILFIWLYEKIEDTEDPKIHDLMKKFRTWIKMDDLIAI